MIYELFRLSDKSECDYDSFALSMTVGELIARATSSNIQRMRNPKKEEGIMRFIKKNIDKKKTPFFQPFILHYLGRVTTTEEGRYVLDAVPNFKAQVLIDDEFKEKMFEFETIDGNGRLNSLIRINTLYTEEILRLTKMQNTEKNPLKLRKIEDKLYEIKNKNKTLKDIKIVVQLYLNLTEDQKAKLFNAVNQGEKMSQGRLKLYDNDKLENILLSEYIRHTECTTGYPYIITPDKDSLRSNEDRKMYIPAVYLLPVIRKIVKYCKKNNIDDVSEFTNEILDCYITKATNPPHLRKHYFSILGTIIDVASEYDEELYKYVCKMLEFDFTRYLDISKQLKIIRQDVVNFVFKKSLNIKTLIYRKDR